MKFYNVFTFSSVSVSSIWVRRGLPGMFKLERKHENALTQLKVYCSSARTSVTWYT